MKALLSRYGFAALLLVFFQNEILAGCEPEFLNPENDPLNRQDSFVLITAPLNLPPARNLKPNWNSAFNYSALRALSDSRITLPIVLVFYQTPTDADPVDYVRSTWAAALVSNQEIRRTDIQCIVDRDSRTIQKLGLKAPIPMSDGTNPHLPLLVLNGKIFGPVYLPINPISLESERIDRLIAVVKSGEATEERLSAIEEEFNYNRRIQKFNRESAFIDSDASQLQPTDRLSSFISAFDFLKQKFPDDYGPNFAKDLMIIVSREWDLSVAQQAIQILDRDFSNRGIEGVDEFLGSTEVSNLRKSGIYASVQFEPYGAQIRFDIKSFRDIVENSARPFTSIAYQVSLTNLGDKPSYPPKHITRVYDEDKNGGLGAFRFFVNLYDYFPLQDSIENLRPTSSMKEIHFKITFFGEQELTRELRLPFFWSGVMTPRTDPELLPRDGLKGMSIAHYRLYTLFESLVQKVEAQNSKISQPPPAPKNFVRSKNITLLNDADIVNFVSNSDRLVMIDFTARWCVWCKVLAPTVSKIADENVNSLQVFEMDIDESPQTKNSYKIDELPTLLFLKKGKEVARLTGYKPEAEIMTLVKALLSTPGDAKK